MIPFDFKARNGARLSAHYTIENGKLIVSYRDETASAAAGVNEIANAFLRDNLMRSILGEIDAAPGMPANDRGLPGPSAA